MHVVIDLGEMLTCVSCWEKGRSREEACISVRIPGLAAYRSVPDPLCWERQNLRDYLTFIYREYLLPSRLVIESAALATHAIFNLTARRTLLDILEEIFGLYEASIIPHPLALTVGLQLDPAQPILAGDLLLIEKQKSSYCCSFVSVIDNAGITLEKQFCGSISAVRAEAERYGYYSNQRWNLDYIILAGVNDQDPAAAAFISALAPAVNIICHDDPGFTATEGLSALSHGQTASLMPPLNVIYPYAFYLSPNRGEELQEIPFDTANLELNCSGSYKLTNLQSAGADAFINGKRANFRIYEISWADQTKIKNSDYLPPIPVFAIDTPLSALPPDFELILDMASASIQLDIASSLANGNPGSPEVLDKKLATTQQKLYQWLSQNESTGASVSSLPLHHDQNLSLPAQIDQTLFHLHGLLQLWLR